MDSNYYYDEIEKVISYNLENRGMDKIKINDQLKGAVKDINKSETVVIVTGFAVKVSNCGETDGPLGALALAYTLEKLNKAVIMVTDRYSEIFIRAGLEYLNLKAHLIIFDENKEKRQAEEIIEKYKPDHIIAIERPGRSVDQKSYSMLGENITNFCPNTDWIFIKAKEKNISTSAIGDGGNEVGMGKVKCYVKSSIKNGNIICAELETDNLIIAGVSNWGAFGICAALSITNNDMMLYDVNIYEDVFKLIVEKGAVDGCSKKRETTVDGLSYEENLNVFEKIREIAKMNINKYDKKVI